ncbi:hypothetical protein LshimejAT787_0602350 [Lyophyllum shimeji]|uniref:Uncharacterized protein n=1 Tax=Lyophyllum shimeji TaxID=47721 RepID=A0A9P3PNE5_LYOSH|nr:hypothetical protein LshimejAT787_0602350 [Lyophyllum shimeji]
MRELTMYNGISLQSIDASHRPSLYFARQHRSALGKSWKGGAACWRCSPVRCHATEAWRAALALVLQILAEGPSNPLDVRLWSRNLARPLVVVGAGSELLEIHILSETRGKRFEC